MLGLFSNDCYFDFLAICLIFILTGEKEFKKCEQQAHFYTV